MWERKSETDGTDFSYFPLPYFQFLYFGKRNFSEGSTRSPQSRSLCCPPLTCRNFRSELSRQPCVISSSRKARACPGAYLPSLVPTSSQIRVEGLALSPRTTRKITP